MKIGPKYKIARRLGAPVFEKTQTQKFALHLERRGRGSGKPKTEFGLGLNEKQKARFTYGLTEKQFSNYVKKAIAKKGNPTQTIFESLENRIDNVVYRLGMARTRFAARQLVSHGHVLVNGQKATPSLEVKIGDTVSIRPGSNGKGVFANLEDRVKEVTFPAWLAFDINTREGKAVGKPEYKPGDQMFDLNAVIEFYSR